MHLRMTVLTFLYLECVFCSVDIKATQEHIFLSKRTEPFGGGGQL